MNAESAFLARGDQDIRTHMEPWEFLALLSFKAQKILEQTLLSNEFWMWLIGLTELMASNSHV